MKLSCNVTVLDLQYNSKKGKAVKGIVSVGYYSRDKSSDPFLHVASSHDRVGAKYKISKNIETIFAKGCDQGRATIRLKEPRKDVMISGANNVELKQLLQCISTILKTGSAPDLTVLKAIHRNDVKPTKTKLIIRERHEYPVTSSFPSTLQELTILPSCQLKRIDRRISQLSNLKVLCLSGHKIVAIDPALFSLKLSMLDLSSNMITDFQPPVDGAPELFDFISKLDLSKNQLSSFPECIHRMSNLSSINLSFNQIPSIHPQVSCLPRLDEFKITQNEILFLPYSLMFRKRKFRVLDVSCNPLTGGSECPAESDTIPPLTTISLDAICNFVQGDVQGLAELLPRHLLHEIKQANRCCCGKLTTSKTQKVFKCSLQKLSETVISIDFAGTTYVPLKVCICSSRCASTYSNLF